MQKSDRKRKNGAIPRPRGRPSSFTEALANEICDRLATGESLVSICRDEHMPHRQCIFVWLKDPRRRAFADTYAHAREAGYERWAEEIIDIGDANYTAPDGTVDNGAVQQARLRSDNRKWLLAKLLPKRFGDRVTAEVVGDANAPLLTRIELVAVAPTRVIDHAVSDDGFKAVDKPK